MFRLLPALFVLLQAVISVRTELVAVPVIVTDAGGRHVPGLGPGNFRVYDEGRLQPVTAFDHGDGPVTIGVIVDRSQSMRPKSAALAAAVSALLESSRPDDELFGVVFNDDVSLALAGGRPFTNDSSHLAAAVSAARAEGRTALYDGVIAGLRQLERGHGQRSALVVVSDGGDNASRRTYADVLALARQSQAVVYAIGLLGTPPAEEDEDAGLLKRLCKDTGGVAYFPRSVEEIASASRQIARDLRDQYTLGFSPGARTDRRAFRKIEVTASAPGQGRLHVRTRSGYSVQDEQPPRQGGRP